MYTETMYTETELRDAIAFEADQLDRPADSLAPAQVSGRGGRRRLAPLVSAAAVLVAAVGVATFAGGSGRHSATSAGASKSAASNPSSGLGRQTSTGHSRLDVAELLDTVALDGVAGRSIDMHPGYEQITQSIDGGEVTATVVHSGLDAARIPRTHPVPIAGVTGFYSDFQFLPLDGDAAPGKRAASPTIAFQDQFGDWVFAGADRDNVKPGDPFQPVQDPSAIAQAYESIHLRYVANESRLPLRLGWLPAGAELQDLLINPLSGGVTETTLSVKSGTKTLELTVSDARLLNDIGLCGAQAAANKLPVECPGTAARMRGDLLVMATELDADPAALDRVATTLTVTAHPSDPSTYWTIPNALS